MTQHWNDIGDSDCIMVIGGNPAENHPISMRHVQRAIDEGAKLICVDPRYTRTAAKAHYYAPMRSGTDIAFIDGMINYAIQHNKYNQKYVLHYTNAGFLLRDDFQRPGDLNGRFSGFSSGDPGSYTTSSWGYAARPSYTDGTVSISGDVLTGSGTLWLENIKKDDKITLPSHTDPGPYYVDSVDSNTQITLKRAASAAGGPGLSYEHESRLAIDLAQDFFDSSGNCICGACTWTNTSLTPNGLAAFRGHLVAAGKLPSNAGLSVWESAKLHYARYDTGTVSAITGCPVTTLNQVYNEYTKTGTVGKAGTIMYAMGTTQHTVGTQNIRAYASLQLLLGNTGLRGGGINACRGESNVQGSTDHCLLFHILPGYLKVPSGTSASDAVFDATDPDIGSEGHPDQPPSYIKRTTPWANHSGELNWWGNTKKYVVSLLKCYWGAKAVGPDFCYDWLPKIAYNHSHISIFEDMLKPDGDPQAVRGLICFGQNPAVGGPNSKLAREGLRKLDWLVVSDLWETETAAFWRYNLQGNKDPLGATSIDTEVFLLPAACHIEKDGSVVNSSRWTQFRYKADSVNPPGHAKHEIEMLNEIYDHVRALCDPMLEQDKPLYHLCMGSWHYDNPYGLGAMGYGTNPPADFIDMEINGFNTTTGDLIGSFGSLQADGSTASGNWLYCGSYTGGNLISGGGTNKATNRDNTPGIAATYSNWAWSWPVNRRIIYNGASLIPCGFGGTTDQSWDSTHPVLVWSGSAWTGDVADGVSPPHGETGHVERGPFIMKNDGHGHVHGFTCAEGPYPEHYEPLENPFAVPGADGVGSNPMGHNQLCNPCAKVWRPGQIGAVVDYPIVGTTYRVSEHWQAGAQTRNLKWLVELVPNVFCEMSKELAASLGVSNGDKVKVRTARGGIKCYAVVTDRFKPFAINGKTVHQIGVIWHFGYKGLATGHSGNILTPHVGDANTMIPEYKAFRCTVVKV